MRGGVGAGDKWPVPPGPLEGRAGVISGTRGPGLSAWKDRPYPEMEYLGVGAHTRGLQRALPVSRWDSGGSQRGQETGGPGGPMVGWEESRAIVESGRAGRGQDRPGTVSGPCARRVQDQRSRSQHSCSCRDRAMAGHRLLALEAWTDTQGSRPMSRPALSASLDLSRFH